MIKFARKLTGILLIAGAAAATPADAYFVRYYYDASGFSGFAVYCDNGALWYGEGSPGSYYVDGPHVDEEQGVWPCYQ